MGAHGWSGEGMGRVGGAAAPARPPTRPLRDPGPGEGSYFV
jgi:hypothetical protein